MLRWRLGGGAVPEQQPTGEGAVPVVLLSAGLPGSEG